MKTCRVPGDEEEFNRKQIEENKVKAVLCFLLVCVCVVVSVWMIYNLVTAGSVFPPEFLASGSDLVSKGFKGFKL